MSVGAEGSHWAGAGPASAEPPVSLPAGYGSATELTCRRPLHLRMSALQEALTAPAGPQLTT